MSSVIPPLQFVLMMFAGWINRRQVDLVEYLKEENRILKERMGGRRIRFTDKRTTSTGPESACARTQSAE